jgi:hypothetical protein
VFLIWEPTVFKGEDRAGWLSRFVTSRPHWPLLSDAQFEAMRAHIEAADYPETSETWLDMGREAGFAAASELLVLPTKLSRVYLFKRQ